jgi:serine/threonine protein kinase/CheY-like chemotaxis protein
MAGARTKLLLVEDNPADARLVFEYLKDAEVEYDIIHVETASEAIEHLISDAVFSLILLDLSLPDSQGLDTIRTIQNSAGTTAIVVMTGLGDEEIGLEAVSLGAQDYLVKGDVDTQKLARSIRFAMKRNARFTTQATRPVDSEESFPSLFGPYTLQRRVGFGGTANIYLAQKKLDNDEIQQCVIKRIKSNLAKEPEVQSLFREEARIGAMLDHPNIVKQFDAGEIAGCQYICLEFISGLALNVCLRHRTNTGDIDSNLFGHLAGQLASGIAYAHELVSADGGKMNIIHRDITPENILLTEDGNVKLVDFGIARFAGRDLSTRIAVPKGKLPYMAPEQLRFEPFDQRADIYSFGIVLAELLSGRCLFPQGILLVTDPENLIRVRCRQNNVSDQLQELLVSMTHVNAERRPASMRSALSDLEELFPNWADPLPTFSMSTFLGETGIHSTSDILASPLAVGMFTTGDPMTGSYSDVSSIIGFQLGSGEFEPIEADARRPSSIIPASFDGRAFGRYDILAHLGKGGMARVDLGTEVAADGRKRFVAIKTLLGSSSASDEERQLFWEEARIGKLLKHPNIIEMYEFGKVNDQPFISMEFVNGLSLRDLLSLSEARRLPAWVCIDIATHLCRALSYAHSLSDPQAKLLHLIHRDLTPENIMISRTGDIKISDFGIAHFEGREIETAFGTLRGKSAYLSPEQAFFQDIDHRVDLYSLGLVLGEMLTGEMLTPNGAVDAQDISETLRSHIGKRVDIPGELIELVLQLTAYDVTDRPPTAAVTAQRLKKMTAQEIPECDMKDYIFRLTENIVPNIDAIDPKKYSRRLDQPAHVKDQA